MYTREDGVFGPAVNTAFVGTQGKQMTQNILVVTLDDAVRLAAVNQRDDWVAVVITLQVLNRAGHEVTSRVVMDGGVAAKS